MVAHSAGSPSFVPLVQPRVSVASDGTLAAVHEPSRVTVVEIPGGAAFAEIGVDAAAIATEAAWVGAPPRLLVLSRYAAHSTVHLLDPYGPRTIAEIRLEAPMRLFATVGAHALAVGALGTAVLTASDTHLTPYQFPARAVPLAAGGAAGQFAVALSSSVEEWDPQARMPKRRLRLPRPAAITAVGGSDRVVWMTTREQPARLDVIALVNRGQPKAHDLPEPIASAVGHPRSDMVVCVGAETGRVYVVDLDGRAAVRTLVPEGGVRVESAALVVGRLTGVLVASAGKPIAIAPLERDGEGAGAPRGAVVAVRGDERDEEARTRSTLGADEDDDDYSDLAGVREVPTSVTISSPHLAEPSPPPRPTERIARPSDPPLDAPRTRLADSRAQVALAEGAWRMAVVAWARAVASGAATDAPPALSTGLASPFVALLARFELLPAIAPAVALLYGAHLGGAPGAAPIDVARVLDADWDEALGRGALALLGLAHYRDSRVHLTDALTRTLDGRAPAHGTLVGDPGALALAGPCVAVAPADEPLAVLAARILPAIGGAILAAAPGADPDALFLEARARGAAPLLPLTAALDQLAIFVVTDAARADALGLPRLA